MAVRKNLERQIIGTAFLGISAFTGVMSIVYLIKFLLFDSVFMGFMAAFAFATTMLFGSLMGIGLNYTVRVPRGREEDRSQVIAAMIMIILGTVICVSMHIILGIGVYGVLSIAFYIQNGLMFLLALYSLKFYFKKK